MLSGSQTRATNVLLGSALLTCILYYHIWVEKARFDKRQYACADIPEYNG